MNRKKECVLNSEISRKSPAKKIKHKNKNKNGKKFGLFYSFLPQNDLCANVCRSENPLINFLCLVLSVSKDTKVF